MKQELLETISFLQKNHHLPALVFCLFMAAAALYWLLTSGFPGVLQKKPALPCIDVEYYRDFFNSPYKTTEEYDSHCPRKKSRFWK